MLCSVAGAAVDERGVQLPYLGPLVIGADGSLDCDVLTDAAGVSGQAPGSIPVLPGPHLCSTTSVIVPPLCTVSSSAGPQALLLLEAAASWPRATNMLPIPLRFLQRHNRSHTLFSKCTTGRQARVELVRGKGQGLRCLLTDLGSKAGTWHNGSRLRPFSDTVVRVGDTMGFGRAGKQGESGAELALAGADLQPAQKATGLALRHLPALQVCASFQCPFQ